MTRSLSTHLGRTTIKDLEIVSKTWRAAYLCLNRLQVRPCFHISTHGVCRSAEAKGHCVCTDDESGRVPNLSLDLQLFQHESAARPTNQSLELPPATSRCRCRCKLTYTGLGSSIRDQNPLRKAMPQKAPPKSDETRRSGGCCGWMLMMSIKHSDRSISVAATNCLRLGIEFYRAVCRDPCTLTSNFFSGEL